ncbi:MAG: NAD(P)-binding domain-containing protein [Chloroflexi bacterium]|nr:NAD(P)-binding domain-containing protein [Chloroflexota bacterium]
MDFPGDPNGYPTKDEVADHLATFVSRFELPVRWGIEVRTLQRVDGLFLATLGDGSTVRARVVVIATGAFQVPSIPALADRFSTRVQQLPSTRYRDPRSVRAGTVLVVGDGATGRQLAHELAVSHRVLLSHGRSRRVTRARILGRNVFWWLDRLGLLRVSSTSAIGRRLRRADPFPSGGHDERDLVRAGVVMLPRLVRAQGEVAHFENAIEERIDAVVWATGFRDDASWVHIPGAADGAGAFLQTDGSSTVPGLFFVGRSWQSTRGSALLLGVSRDADVVIRRALDYLVRSTSGGQP